MSRHLLLLLGLVGLAACAVPTAEEEADDGDSAIKTNPDGPVDHMTHFASGDVDLTTYRKAGKAEWTAFRALYESRHTHPKETDDLATVETRVKPVVPAKAATELTSFVALKGYTLETMWFHTEKTPITQDYKLINTALRNLANDPKSATAAAELTKVESYVKSAASALNAMPPVTGIVHRRVFRANCDAACMTSMTTRYAEGARVVEPSFVSTSEKEQATCGFRGQWHFVITAGGKAHSLGDLSDFPDEKEALFAPGATFKIVKVQKDVAIKCDDPTWYGGLDDKTLKAPTKETIVTMTAE